MEYKLTPELLSTEYFTTLIASNLLFTVARYGDGEWESILGDKGRNCDGVQYTPELRGALRNTLHRPENYIYGILRVAFRRGNRVRINNFCEEHSIDIPWKETTCMVSANRRGKLGPFIKALRSRDIIYIGPRYMKRLNETIFPYTHYVTVPDHAAFDDLRRVEINVLKNAELGDLIGISMGPAAKVLIHRLYHYIGHSHSIVDFGSLWDGYLGRASRQYMRRKGWKATMKKNLREAN